VTGSGNALTVELSNGPLVFLANKTETGPVSLDGANTSAVVKNGAVALLGGQLNSEDAQAVQLSHMFFLGTGALGQLTTSDADLSVGNPVRTLEAASAKLDPESYVEFNIVSSEITPATGSSELVSQGAIELNGARVEVVVRPPSKGASCPVLEPGATYTFVSTTGTLSGSFSNAPEHGEEIPIRFAKACTPKSQTLRIAYHQSGVTQTVTGTVEEAAATKKHEEEQKAKEKAEREAKEKAEREAKERAEREAKEKAEREAKEGREREAKERAEAEARREAEETARREHEEALAAEKRKQEEEAAAKGTASSGLLGTNVANVSSAQVAALLGHELTPTGKTAKIATLLRRGGFTIAFKALEAGRAVIDWYEVPPGAKLAKAARAKPVLAASGALTFSAAGTEKLKIALTSAGRRLLKRTNRLTLSAKGTFTPAGEPPVTVSRTFVLRR